VGVERAGVCAVVLAAGCGGAAFARYAREPHGGGVFVSADDAGGDAGAMGAAVCGLSVFGVQHEHGIVSDGYAGVEPVGEGTRDGAGGGVAGDRGVAGGTGSEHHVGVDQDVTSSSRWKTYDFLVATYQLVGILRAWSKKPIHVRS